jgi:hypothetical protein
MTTDTAPTITKDSTHYLIDGRKYTRVSRILDTIANPALQAWRERTIARTMDLDAPDAIGRAAAEKGTALHAEIQVINGPVGPAACAALNELHKAGLVMIETERAVWHDDLGYAGTLDALAEDKDGAIALLDWKTSTRGGTWNPRHALQLGAYALALYDQEGIKVTYAHTVCVQWGDPPTATLIDYSMDLDDIMPVFDHLATFHQWLRRHEP